MSAPTKILRALALVLLAGLATVPAASAAHRHARHRQGRVVARGFTVRRTRLSLLERRPDVTKTKPGSTAASAAVPSATPPGPRVTLPSATPAYARPDALRGQIQPSESVPITLVLAWQHPQELAQLITAVTTPGTADYGHYLTPAQFRARFSPSAGDQAAARSFLRSSGLTVDGVSTNGTRVAAHGSAAQVQAAFGTALNTYASGSRTLRAPARAPSVPTALDGVVTSVQGLDQAGVKKLASPAPLFRQATPCGAYYAQLLASDQPRAFGAFQPYVTCGYSPAQLRSAYGLAAADDGTGISVGIIDAYASPTIEQDTDTWAGRHATAPLADGQLDSELTPSWLYDQPETYDPDPDDDPPIGDDPQGWYGEETLDVQAVHGVAPKAKIVYAGARDPSDVALDDTLNDVIDSGLTNIVSNSYGDEGESSPTVRAAFDAIAQEAAVTGVGLYFSSGDDGDEKVIDGQKEVDFPASDPNVTAVGGTALKIGASNNYLGEEYWGTDKSLLTPDATGWDPTPGTPSSFLYGGGGGTSATFAAPPYQAGTGAYAANPVPAALATDYATGATAKHRVLPDISAVADPQTGYQIGQTQTASDGTVLYDEARYGGTSLASPVTAAIMAIADQRRAAAAKPQVGFANPALYTLARSAFHDVNKTGVNEGVVRVDYVNGEDAGDGLTYSLRTFNDLQGLTSRAGYDDSTGLGTPNGNAFLTALTSVAGYTGP